MKISKTKIGVFSSLSSKKMRLKHGLFLAEGAKCALDTIGTFELVGFLATAEWLSAYRGELPIEEAKIMECSESDLRKISSLSSAPDVIAVFRLPQDRNPDTVTLDADTLYLMIDGVQDPGNLGTIIRTADWFGFKNVICSLDTVDVFNPKTVQATMGSLRRVKVIYTDLVKAIRNNGIKHVYGTLLDGKDIYSASLGSSGVIVMGNEGNGLSSGIRELITDPLLIPPYDPCSCPESLNVAIASAVVMAQFRK